ncbi:response regulator transcription factor [Massilia sp. CF038]|uniref:response regulator transcription factor n=1 Tax=Massilia sp. CF038 TaxID=1881045 RepID=UPI00090EF338|nr:response regulator [Massilia sp. CF038]SHH14784.1 two-component system, chemotaxis family, response regulator CheY [Massilia sp. CF038]
MKALIVDDDAVARMALMDLLGEYDIFDLVEADDGQSAWTLIEDGLAPAICFCDVRMPRMSGIELLEKIKAHPDHGALPVVLVSSASDRETVLQAVRLGAVGYILKPLLPAEARAHLDKIFKLTIDKLAEAPAATMARLNIGAERLLTYLAAFATQVSETQVQLSAMLAQGRTQEATLRVDAMHNGCMTLGLWQAAASLKLGTGAVLDAAVLAADLAAVALTVAQQERRVRACAAGAT